MDLTALRTSVEEREDLERSAGAAPGAAALDRGDGAGVPAAAWLGLILLAATVLRFLRLSGQSLWLDEVLSVARARTIFLEGFDAQLLNGHGPLFFYLIAPLLALDPGEFLLRLPSAIFGVGLVLVLYFLGREFDGRRGGLLAALVTAVSPFAIWYSQEARYVNLFILLAAISLLFTRRFERGGARELVMYVVATLLMLLSFVAGVFLILAQNLWMIFVAGARGRRLGRWLLAQGLVAVVFVPWLLRAYEINIDVNPLSDAGSSDFSVAELKAGYPRSTQPLQIGYVFLVYGVGYSFGPSTQDLHHNPSLQPVKAKAAQVMAAVALIGLVGLAGITRSFQRSPRDAALLVLCVLCPILGAYILASVSRIAFNVRYTAAAYPAFVLLFSAGLLWWKERSRLGVLVLAGVGVMLGVSLFNHYENPEYFKEDSRGAAHLLERLRKPDERLLVGASVIPFEYYYRQPFERWTQVELRAQPPSPGRGDGPDRVWVAATRTWQSAGFQSFLDRMRDCYPVESRYVLPGYELLSYRLASSPRPATCTLEDSRSANARMSF